MLIYLLTNLTNGKRYVGQTRLPLARRWKQHLRDANNGSTTLIGRALRKYGAHAFSSSVLCTCASQKELDARECEYISVLGTHSSLGKGYNLTAGGFGGQHGAVGPMTGKRHSSATRERMRKAHEGKKCPSRGRPNGAAHLLKLPRTEKGRVASRIAGKNMGLANKGRTHTFIPKADFSDKLRLGWAARLSYYGA